MQWLNQQTLFVLFIIVPVLSFAQEVPRIRHFTPSDYKAQNQNWSLTQSEEGWIYAGNNSGLLELDGAQAALFVMPEKQTVRAIAMGKNGEIFGGGVAEFGYWKTGKTGRLEYTSLSASTRADQLVKDEIWHILVLPNYVLFQSFSTIYKYDYQKVTILQPPGNIMFAQQVNGRVLLPIIGRGLYEILPDQTFKFIESTEILRDKSVQFLVQGSDSTVWMGTANNGIFCLKNGQCKPWDNPLNALFKKYQLNKAVALQKGGWAIGTILNGAYILDTAERLSHHIHRENGLQNNTVLALMEDRNNNLWLGLDRGIDCVELDAPIQVFDDQTGQIGTVYSAAVHQGQLYIGTNHGVFMRLFKAKEGALGNEKFRLIEGSQGQIWEIQLIDDQLIIGHNDGTFVIKNGIAQKISDVTGGWCLQRIPGRSDALIQGTYSGLVVFKKNRNGRWQFGHRVEGFNEPLKKIAFDDAGDLWGSHPNKGLFRLHLSDDLTRITALKSFSKSDGLTTDFQLDLVALNGQLVVNTRPVPLHINTNPKISALFQKYPSEFSGKKILSGNENEYFTVDSSGINLTMGESSISYPITLVPSYECIVPLAAHTYLFCLENGFALLDKRQITPISGKTTPAVVIRRIETGDGGSFLPIADYHFKWEQNSVKFHFSIPVFERQPQFSYKLEGFSQHWSPWQTSAEKEFTNLPDGNYIFIVRSDLGGQEGRLSFNIDAPWYRSGLAYTVYALLAILLFIGFEKYNRARLNKQRKQLEAEKERELARQRTEAEHEILLLEVDTQNRELSNAAFNLIRKNEAMQSLKDELLTSAKDTQALDKIIRQIDEHLEGDHDWEIFEASFNRVHDDFIKRLLLQFPELTPGDLRLAAYLKMNLASKEIAPLFNISVRGVENKRYRLRKKIGLSEEDNLTEFILKF
jgi:hypothetical protein